MTQIKIILNQALDHEISKHVEVSHLQGNQLRLIVDSPAWATRLRYKQTEIINRFQNYAITKVIKFIHIKISPSITPKNKRKVKTNTIALSPQSANRMLKEIEAIPDSDLKQALIRITRHAK